MVAECCSDAELAGFQDLCLLVSPSSFKPTRHVSLLITAGSSKVERTKKLHSKPYFFGKPSMHRLRSGSFFSKKKKEVVPFNIKTQHKDHHHRSQAHKMEKRRESGRVTEQRELLQVQDYVMHMVLLTAGASVSVLMVFLMEQWRAWVFIVLNLVLLAILFTSVSSTSSENQECNSGDGEVDRVPVKVERKETRQCRWPPAQVDQEVLKECDEEWFEVEDKMEEEEVPKLSKDALNERVEAFILMFRQHLVSDARN